MIQEFIAAFDAHRDTLRAQFKAERPGSYEDIVRVVVGVLKEVYEYGAPDPDRIVRIDHGDYQGTLLFVIGAQGYQPNNYWYVKVGYGSCSGCDTLQGICDWDCKEVTDEQANEYLTLALHVVQGLRSM